MEIIFQLVGLAGSILGLYGFYGGNTVLMIIGMIPAVLFCKCNSECLVEQVVARILLLPLLSLPGMFICHFAVKMAWGKSFLLCYLWMLAITSFLFIFPVVKGHKKGS